MEIINLKGGSLSSTVLIKDNDNKFVRKSVSLKLNREYGYQRWYSQYKKLQRYSIQYPSIFPKIINMNVDRDNSYFDMEYFEESKNGFEFLLTSDTESTKIFFDSVVKTMNELHSIKLDSYNTSIELYLHEEIDCRIKDAVLNETFKNFLDYKTIIFQNEEIPSFIFNIEKYKNISRKYYKNFKETFTHGNLTLENILYVPNENRVIFIDPYEENVIDSDLSEISQLRQSSNSLYELYNENNANIIGNKIDINVEIPSGIKYFNELLEDYINKTYDDNSKIIIRILEISQFIRMLPFKVVVNPKKSLFFYGVASKLLDELIRDLN
jgi:hypothetical protein